MFKLYKLKWPARHLFLRLRKMAWGIPFNRSPYNFGVVKEGRLYRSSRPDPAFFEFVKKAHGIRTVVNLCGLPDEADDLKVFHFHLNSRQDPDDETLNKILNLFDQPENWPILVHCVEGADRTGLLVALARLKDGWTLDQIKKEMYFYHYLPILAKAPLECVKRRISTS